MTNTLSSSTGVVPPQALAVERAAEAAVMLAPTGEFLADEARLHLELDAAFELGQADPLRALDRLIAIGQAINIELIKAHAPALLETARRNATEFARSGEGRGVSKAAGRTLAALQHLQLTAVKLGIARVRVQEERMRRSATGGCHA